MRKYSKSLCGAILMVMLELGVSAADAGLVLSLRYSDASTSKTFTTADLNSTVTVNVWAKVTGVDGDPTNDGFAATAFAGYRVLSSVTGTSLTPRITSSSTSSNFTSNGSLNGTIQDLNGDGVLDIGGTSDATKQIDTLVAGGTDIKARAGVAVFNVDSTTEILLSSFTVNISALADAATSGNQVQFYLQVPSHQSMIANRPASWNQDSTTAFTSTTGTSGQSPTNYTVGSSVFFTEAVPEPTSLGVLGATVLGMLATRRRDHA